MFLPCVVYFKVTPFYSKHHCAAMQRRSTRPVWMFRMNMWPPNQWRASTIKQMWVFLCSHHQHSTATDKINWKSDSFVGRARTHTQVETESQIVFTSEHSLEATFSTVSMENVTKLLVDVNVFGYHLQFIPNDTATILWNADFLRTEEYQRFSVGERDHGDDEIFYSAKRTAVTPTKQNHSIEFDVNFEMYITLLEIMVNVCAYGPLCARLSNGRAAISTDTEYINSIARILFVSFLGWLDGHGGGGGDNDIAHIIWCSQNRRTQFFHWSPSIHSGALFMMHPLERCMRN